MLKRLALIAVFLSGCRTTTSHAVAARATLSALGDEATLTVVTQNGDEHEFPGPFEGRLAAGQIEVTRPLVPSARFVADDLARVETTVPSPAKTAVLVGGAVAVVAAAVAGGVALSFELSRPRPFTLLGNLNSPLGY